MIVLCSFKDLSAIQRSARDINFAIVRNYKETITGVQQFSRLAPSTDLYHFAMCNKDKDGFWELYHEAFNRELLCNEKQVGLAIIEDMYNQGFEINLMCYCKDPKQCHRSDVYDALVARGLECRLL
jgi:uncharacterized protein YeaO (DUF488 family)